MSTDDADFEAELLELLAEGRKIEAVKRYRDRTCVGLAEAKRAVEALEQGESLPAEAAFDSDAEAEIVSLLGQGRKIQAVKLYRERTGVGLKEAKDAVEALGEKHGLGAATGGGCLGVVILLLLLIFAGVGSASKGDETSPDSARISQIGQRTPKRQKNGPKTLLESFCRCNQHGLLPSCRLVRRCGEAGKGSVAAARCDN
jgi:ribosomal protein L7/L12